MKFIYDKKTNEVKMHLENDGIIRYNQDIMSEKIINPTENELQNINDNDRIFIKNNKLVFEDNPFKLKAKERTEKLQKIDKCKTIEELKDLLKEII